MCVLSLGEFAAIGDIHASTLQAALDHMKVFFQYCDTNGAPK
jgi:hypothetical protein